MRLVNRLILSVMIASFLLGCCSGNNGQVVESYQPCKPYSRMDVLTSPGEWSMGKSNYTQVGVKLDRSVSIKLPSRQWMHYMSPHGYPEYSRERCSYRGGIILGSTTLKEVDFKGIPLCAFLHNSETYFLTLNPFFIYPEEAQLDRALFHTYLYKIEENNELGPVSYIGVTDAYKYTQSFISRYQEALSIFKCLNFESEWQNSVIFYDILRMYLELIEEMDMLKYQEGQKLYSGLIPSQRRQEARKLDAAKLQKEALAYISQALRANPGIMRLNMREHIREDGSLCLDIEKYSFEAAKRAILEIYNSDYLSQEEKQEYRHILDYISGPSFDTNSGE